LSKNLPHPLTVWNVTGLCRNRWFSVKGTRSHHRCECRVFKICRESKRVLGATANLEFRMEARTRHAACGHRNLRFRERPNALTRLEVESYCTGITWPTPAAFDEKRPGPQVSILWILWRRLMKTAHSQRICWPGVIEQCCLLSSHRTETVWCT